MVLYRIADNRQKIVFMFHSTDIVDAELILHLLAFKHPDKCPMFLELQDDTGWQSVLCFYKSLKDMLLPSLFMDKD